MRGGTLFSGIGAPECAMPAIDWRWCADIDPFACAVHKARFPHVPNLGDVTRIETHAIEPVDLIGAVSPRRLSGRSAWQHGPRRPSRCWQSSAPLGGLGECPRRPRRETGERVARCVAAGTNSQRYDGESETAGTLTSNGDAHSGFKDERGLVTHSLRADGFDASEDGTGRGTPLVPIDMRQASRGAKITNNRANGSGGPPGHGVGDEGDPAFTVSERGQAIAGMSVRRLTPRECERLRGFPDDYTLVPHRGKPAADGPRYRAIGNSMAVPVMRWILGRVSAVDALLRPRLAA